MTTNDASKEFRETAIAKGDLVNSPKQDHRLHAQMTKAAAWLLNHGESGQMAFASMLLDESPHVRLWVAAELLSQGDLSAIPVIESLCAQTGILGFTAKTTLGEFQAGRLRSPFGINH